MIEVRMPLSGKSPCLVHVSDRRDDTCIIWMQVPFTLPASIFATMIVSSTSKAKTGLETIFVTRSSRATPREAEGDPPPLKWSDLRYVFDIKEDCNGKE